MNEHQLSEPAFSPNKLKFVNTSHDVSINNVSLLGCGDLDRSSVSLTKPVADTTVCRKFCSEEAEVIEKPSKLSIMQVLWDSKLKLRRLFGGHFNIRSITAKSNQLTHVLSDSNLDFLFTFCSMVHVFMVPVYRFRRDKPDGRGGEMIFFVRDNIKFERVAYNAGYTLLG